MFRKFILLLIALGVLACAADFQRWVSQVRVLEADDDAQADAVVALTGGGGRRIQAALAILESGTGERLLVSGVHESVNVAALVETAGGSQALYDCCIDIGRLAHSTEGNAQETSNWVREHEYDSLILVTSNYHMPRALLWFKEGFEGVEIIPYPVESSMTPPDWWKSWPSIKGLVLEWAKYRVTGVMKVLNL
ncbi:YdcF family protein [Ponticaulis sp.]|uniref:YdcF family protein n=1 Tax=Ponticaulis sp. TaxID=2020902 RepID=UPI0025FCA95D|nr:YdcF family protein [Ponticaulis sp.]